MRKSTLLLIQASVVGMVAGFGGLGKPWIYWAFVLMCILAATGLGFWAAERSREA